MRNRSLMQPLALILCGLLASPLLSPLSALAEVSALGRVVASMPATMNGVAIPGEGTAFSGDQIATGPAGWARLFVADGEQVHLGAESAARAHRTGEEIEVELLAGQVALQTRAGSALRVESNGLIVAPKEGRAVWEVRRLDGKTLLVAAHQGSVEVYGTNQSLTVPAGRGVRVEAVLMADPPPAGPAATAGLSVAEKAAIAAAVIAGITLAAALPQILNDVESPSGQQVP